MGSGIRISIVGALTVADYLLKVLETKLVGLTHFISVLQGSGKCSELCLPSL